MARAVVGTSGWAYGHWRGPFFPPSLKPADRFSFYAERFASVELNAPFYRLPSAAVVSTWKAACPPGFRYAVKGSRFITHMKRLSDPVLSLEAFAQVLDGLGETAEIALFQLPPRWNRNVPRLEAFLAAYRKRCGDRRVTFEFRDPSWYDKETLTVLRDFNAAFCIYELDGHQTPLAVTAPYMYVRLHGPRGKYAGWYGQAGLAPWLNRIRAWIADGLDVYCYFDNDIAGAAPDDAALLQRMLEEAPSSS